MESFALMKNALIDQIDSNGLANHVKHSNLKGKFKTQKRIFPSVVYSGGPVYSQSMSFDVPREYDNLCQLGIWCNLSIGPGEDIPEFETYFATKLFTSIVFRTKSGTILGTIKPHYSSMRIDELLDTPLYSQIIKGIEPPNIIPTDTGNFSVFLPFFLFISEQEKTAFLKTRHLEPLEVLINVSPTKESIGSSMDLTMANFELHALYFDTDKSSKKTDELMSIKYTPGPLIGSYNVFYEDDVLCPIGSTSARLLIRCPSPAFNIHFCLVNSDTEYMQVKTMKMTVQGKEIASIDFRSNYTLFNNKGSFIPSGTLSHWFSQDKNRNYDSGLLTFGGSFYPTYIEVTFDEIEDSDYTLHTFLEYRTNLMVNDMGMISPSNDELNVSSSVTKPLPALNSDLQ